jgi:hypothetical protein
VTGDLDALAALITRIKALPPEERAKEWRYFPEVEANLRAIFGRVPTPTELMEWSDAPSTTGLPHTPRCSPCYRAGKPCTKVGRYCHRCGSAEELT